MKEDETLHSTGRVISSIRLALPNPEGAMLLLLYASDICRFRDTNCQGASVPGGSRQQPTRSMNGKQIE